MQLRYLKKYSVGASGKMEAKLTLQYKMPEYVSYDTVYNGWVDVPIVEDKDSKLEAKETLDEQSYTGVKK